jgi:hypothetical protein
MATNNFSTPKEKFSKPYAAAVVSLTVILPAMSAFAESVMRGERFASAGVLGKWFIFWAVGVRLFSAGIRQVVDPAFTARDIFHIENSASHAIVRELGFANICFGVIGIISLFLPQWRIVGAFGSGLFYGIAGFNHLIKKPASLNETIALVSDIFIFLVLLAYVARAF